MVNATLLTSLSTGFSRTLFSISVTMYDIEGAENMAISTNRMYATVTRNDFFCVAIVVSVMKCFCSDYKFMLRCNSVLVSY